MLSPSIGGATPEALTVSPSGRSKRGSHQLGAVDTCDSIFTYAYEFNLRRKATKDNKLFGTLVHLRLQYHYAAMMKQPPAWLKLTSLEAALARDGEGRLDLVRSSSDCFNAYVRRWKAEPFVPIAVEQEFSATIGELDPGGPDPSLDSEVVTCKSDLIVERGGLVWIVDHKTAAPDPKTGMLYKWKDDGEYKLNLQVMVNLLVVRARLKDRFVDSFTINRIKSEHPYDDHDRHTVQVPRLAYEKMPRILRNLVAKERALRAKTARGEPPDMNLAACYGRYGPCDYADICAASTAETQSKVIDALYVIQ